MADVDIYVGGTAQELRTEAPTVYDDYAVRSASEIFIQDDLHTLLFKPEFIAARDQVFGGRSPEFIDIRVTPQGSVLVKAPGSPDWIDTRFNSADTHVKAIAAKTQRAYQELQSSRESSLASSTESSPRPLSERHVVHQPPFPYPEVREELGSLRRENQELRDRLQHLEEQSHLDRSDALLRDVSGQLRANQEANQALLEEIGGLREEVQRGQHTIQESLSRCLELLARLEEQSRLSPAQLEELQQLRENNGRLQEELRGARDETRVALEAKDAFERQLGEARETLERLGEENAGLKRALEEVDDAIGGRKVRDETNPAAIRRLISEMNGLEERVGVQDRELATLRERAEAYAQAMERQQAALGAVGETLGRGAPSIEELPQAVANMKGGLEREIQRVSEGKREVEEREQALLEELGRLRPENAKLREDLAAIEEAIRGGSQGEESIPDTISRVIRELGESGEALREATTAHQAAMQKQQKALAAVGRALGKKITSIEELPGAVSEALQQAEEREADLNRRTLQAEAELLGERSLVVDEQQRSDGLRRELASMRQELVQARGEIEALKGAARKVAKQHRAEVEGLQGEVEEKGRQVKQQKALVRDLRSQLRTASSELEAARRTTQSQQSEIRRLGGKVSTLESQVEQAGEREKALRAELQSAQDTIHEQSSAAEEQQRAFEAKEREHHTAQEENQELTEQLDQARRDLEEATRAHHVASEAQERKIVSLTDQVEDLTRQLKEATSTGEDLQEQLDTVSAQKREAERQVRALQAQLEEKGGEIDRLTSKVQRREATIDRQRRDLTRGREELAEEAIRRSQMERAHSAEVIPLRAKVQELTEGLVEAEERGKRVGETNTDLHQQLEEARRELEQARLQHGSDERTNLEMAEELERMTAEKVRLEQLLGAIDQYEKENAHLAAGTRSLADELADLDTTGPTYARLPENIRLIIEALKSQIAELKQEQRALDEMEQRIVSLQLDLQGQTEATEFAQGNVARLKQALKEQEEAFGELEASHREKRSQQSAVLRQLRTTIRREREEAERQIGLRDEEIRELQQEKRDLERTVATQAATILETQGKLEVLESNYDDVDKRNEQLLEQLRQLRVRNASLSQEIQSLEEDRDYYKEAEAGWKGKYNEKRDALTAVERELSKVRLALQHAEQEYELLRSENKDLYALLREHLDDGIFTLHDAEGALLRLKERHVRALEQKDLQIAERQEEVERLLDRVRRTEEKRLKMREERNAAREETRVASRDLLQAQRENRSLQDEVSSAREARERLQSTLASAQEQMGSQAEIISRNVEDVRKLREANHALGVELESAQSSLAAESRRIEELAAKHEDELRQAREVEERQRRELSELERQQANARDTTELMTEITSDLSSSVTLHDLFPNQKLRSYTVAYLKAMKAGKLPSRYDSTINVEISGLNSKPGPLLDLKFFTPFFGITDQISQIKSSRLFFRLQANKALLKTLDPVSDKTMITKLRQQNKDITTRLLRFFFQKVQEATQSGPCSRFENLGKDLWVWDTIFHGLDSSFYTGGSSEAGFKSTAKGVNLAKAESMRQTVHALHTRFQQMMAPLVPLLESRDNEDGRGSHLTSRI